MATCAICLQPIVEGRFRLVETEVVHRQCALAGGETQGQRMRKQIAALTAQQAVLQREAADKIYDAQQSLRTVNERVRRLSAEISERSADNLTLTLTVGAHQATIADLRQQVADRDRRLATAPPTSTTRAEEQDTRDATEVRFSLLEFDPLA